MTITNSETASLDNNNIKRRCQSILNVRKFFENIFAIRYKINNKY